MPIIPYYAGKTQVEGVCLTRVILVNPYSLDNIHYRDRLVLEAQTRFVGLDWIEF
jgi:hypothetical protein